MQQDTNEDPIKEETKKMTKEETKKMTKEVTKPEANTRVQKVRCNGDAQGSGHPVVYLSLNDEGFVVCPYCSQRFGDNS